MTDITADVAERIKQALDNRQKNSARSALARNGYLGASDIGFCRQKARLVVGGIAPTDNHHRLPIERKAEA